MRVPGLLLACLLVSPLIVSAQSIDEILRTHLAAVGGKERVFATRSLRATGTTKTPQGELEFVMLAARPNLIRVETKAGTRLLTQVYNGAGTPFEFDSSHASRGWVAMDSRNAARFIADSDFDDPLVAALNGRFTADYAGEETGPDGRRLKILLTRTSEAPFWVFLDPDTYLVMGRLDIRPSPLGGSVRIQTHYDDFRLVGGMLVPQHVVVSEGGQKIQDTLVTVIEANPTIPSGAFEPPALSVPDSIATPAPKALP